MNERIRRIEVYPIYIPRDTPYMGPLEPGTTLNSRDHFIRPGNRSVYGTSDHCTLVRVETADGAVGWGECVAVIAPEIAASILEYLVGPLVLGRDPMDAGVIYDDLYDAMRVRGIFGGFYHDALAALDIALWDLRGRLLGVSVATLLGGRRRDRLPAYVSGLPRETLPERVELAQEWIDRGFGAVKYAGAVASEGVVTEMRALRDGLGDEVEILVDLHWRYTAAEAIRVIRRLEEYDLAVAEAPVKPEDIGGQTRVTSAVSTPVAIGEELRTIYEFQPRFTARCMDVIQPEVGRTGLTAFRDICRMAEAFHCSVMPHAAAGIGVYQAASLQAASTLPNVTTLEYQHSILERNLQYVTGDIRCERAEFSVPDGPGLGVVPVPDVLDFAVKRVVIK